LHAPVYINKSVTKLVLNNNLNIPSVDDNGIGDDLIVMGFGLEKEHEEGGVIQQTLRDVIVPYVTNEVCSASYGNIFPEMLCAGMLLCDCIRVYVYLLYFAFVCVCMHACMHACVCVCVCVCEKSTVDE
jgi:hypothetical protein